MSSGGGSMSGLNIADIFETVVATVPDKPALVVRTGDGHNEVRLTFAELEARVNRLAHALLRLGVRVGDHIGTHLYDGNQYIEATLAAYKVRAVPVNVNFRYVDEELTYLFDNADLKLVVTEPDLEERAVRAAVDAELVVPGSGCGRALRSAACRRTRYQTGRGGAFARRSLRPLDRGHDRHAEGRHLAPGRHLSVRDRRQRQRVARHRTGEGPRRRRRARAKGTPLAGTLTLCPLMHGGGFWLAFQAILAGSFCVLIRDTGFDPAFALRVIGEEHVRLLMTIGDAYAAPDRRCPREVGPGRVRPVVAARVRIGRCDPVAVGEG